MNKHTYNNKEIKLTAALYATRPDVIKHVKKYGTLPAEIPNGGMHIGMRLLIESRGTDITLTSNEKLVYNAIIKERRLPGGSVLLLDE